MIAYRKKNRAKIKVDKKIQNIKLKDNNRKRKQRHPELYNNTETPVNINPSRERERKHRQKKKFNINLPFTPKNTKKVQKATEVIKNSLPRTPKSKARTLINIINSQSQITKTNTITNTYSTSHTTQEIGLTLLIHLVSVDVKADVVIDRFSNCSRRLVMEAIADQDAKKKSEKSI